METFSDLDNYIDTLKLIFINSPTGVLIIDPNCKIAISNKVAETILKEPNLKGKDLAALYDGKKIFKGDESSLPLKFEQLPYIPSLEGEKIIGYQYAIEASSNTQDFIRVSSQAIKDASGVIKGAIVLLDNVTEMVLKEREVQVKEHEHESIIQSSSDFILIVDRNGIIEYINRVLNQTPQDAIGKDVCSFLDEKSGIILKENLDLAFKTGDPQTYNTEVFLNGKMFYYQSTITLFETPHSEIKKAIITSADVTKIKEAEIEIKQKNIQLNQLNEELRQYNYMATHDLKLPIANIQGYMELLQDEITINNEIGENCVHWIFESLKQANNKIADLIDLSKARETNNQVIESIRIEDIINECLSRFKEQLDAIEGFKLSLSLSKQKLKFDKSTFSSVFDNLFSNAIKYKSTERALNIDIKSYQDNSKNVVIEFNDNGIGIDKDKLGDRIFNLFERFHEDSEGSGLGLHLIKSIVERANGSIYYESELGRGTTFFITLPKAST